MAVILAFALIPLAMLLALFGLYVFVFRRVNSPAFRAGLSVFALGFIFTELFLLYLFVSQIFVSQNGSRAWKYIEALPVFKALEKHFDAGNYLITLPFWFFLICGLLAAGITFFINRIMKNQKADSQIV